MLYQQPKFQLPSNTAKISKELWAYRLGIIDAVEYERLTGEKPDQEKICQDGLESI